LYAGEGAVSDQTTNVEELKTTVAKFVAARDWERYHSPKNLAMSISIEAAEIMEHFQWLTVEEADEAMADPKVREEVEEEVADVLIYCLSFANQTGIDVSEVIRKKLERNEGRFPVEKVKGFGVDEAGK
jgi:dCTP diphosphatase